MPKLILQFEDRVLKEFAVGPDITIGRLPDNTLIIDNPAVSGHHARVFLEGERYVVEDLRSRNGTYVNQKHVVRQALQNGDVLLVGKHKLVFDESAASAAAPPQPVLPTLGETAYLDTKRHRALLAKLREDRARERVQAKTASDPAISAGVGSGIAAHGSVLQVLDGQSDQSEYRLEARTSFIGKSEAALVRLRGWFSPRAAAAIVQTEGGYTITPLDGKTLINKERLLQTRELKDGDLLEVSGLLLRFRMFDQPDPSTLPGSDSEAGRVSTAGGEAAVQ